MRALTTLLLCLLPAAVLADVADGPEETRVHGSVALSWYHFEDLTESGLDYDRPAARLTLRATGLWGKDYNLRVRLRTRYNDRARSPGEGIQETEWRSRVYEVSFSYDDADAPINFKVGRIVTNDLGGVGYTDGALLQHNLGDNWRWGVLGGTRPDWKTSDFQTSVQKYCAFVGYRRGDYATSRLEATLAAVGEYEDSEVSREFVYLRSSFRNGRRLDIYGSLELDVNRRWRKERAGEDVGISALYLRGRYKVSDDVTVGLGYDTRRNYYTQEVRSVADSLFIDAFRYGGRASVDARLPGDYRLHADFGVRGVESEDDLTYSYAAEISKSDLFGSRLRVALRAAGFSGPHALGTTPSVRLSRSFGGGHSVQLAYGAYSYGLESADIDRLNHWVRCSGQLELPARFYLSSNYEYDWGDDAEGHRMLGEIGYRF